MINKGANYRETCCNYMRMPAVLPDGKSAAVAATNFLEVIYIAERDSQE